MAEKTSQNRMSGSIGAEEKPYKCMLCSKMYRTKGQLRRHILSHSAAEWIHKCSLCPKAFKTKTELTIHISVHSDDKPHACTECNATFKGKEGLRRHTRQHKQELCLCEFCEKTFNAIEKLNRHQVLHSEDRPFKCPECDLAFKRKVELKRHKRTHRGGNPYICDQCGKSFIRLFRLRAHKRTQHQASKTSYSCEQCTEVFSHKCGLKSHQRMHAAERLRGHDDTGSEDIFARNSNPSEADLHSCETCGLSYTEESGLYRHLKTHTKCRLTSSAQSESKSVGPDTVLTSKNLHDNLSRHKRPRYQVSETSYSCGQCFVVFSHKSGLKSHQRIHAAERLRDHSDADSRHTLARKSNHSLPNLHSSQVCGVSYTEKSGLNRLLKTHVKGSSPAQSEGQCDDPDKSTVFTSTILHEEQLDTPTPTIRGIPCPSQTYLKDRSYVLTVHGAVSKTDCYIQGRSNAGGNLLTNPSATRETEDAIRGAPVHSSQSDSRRTQLGRFTSPSQNRPNESNQRDITFWEEEIGQVPVSAIAQTGTLRVAERTAADPGRVTSLFPSELLEEVNDMKDGVEERNTCNTNHHIDPHIQQYHHQLQQQQVAEELLQMVKAVTTPTDPATSGRSESMNH